MGVRVAHARWALNEAYNRCVDNIGKVNLVKYINAILESVDNAGIHTLKSRGKELPPKPAAKGAQALMTLTNTKKYDIFATEK